MASEVIEAVEAGLVAAEAASVVTEEGEVDLVAVVAALEAIAVVVVDLEIVVVEAEEEIEEEEETEVFFAFTRNFLHLYEKINPEPGFQFSSFRRLLKLPRKHKNGEYTIF